ncbi:MAG: glutamine-hydrolyzing GMP synthase [Spirochaetales bacterium]|nr:glutamine-hydrolyzing GMP synthase [Spirochaetales bacterium]
MDHDKIVVLDFGSQYAHLIAKRLRLMGFYSEIALPQAEVASLAAAKGIVFSGGPSSVYDEHVPEFNSDILKLDIPILGLCYGHQLMAKEYGASVGKAEVGEFGIAHLTASTGAGNAIPASPLFEGIALPSQVWMSHQDAVLSLPAGFETVASTKDCPYAALQDLKRKRFSLQCHVEVKDTPEGDRILANFANRICGMEKNWSRDQVLETIMTEIRDAADGRGIGTNGRERDGKKRKVLLFLSGGVDSTVAFALLNAALGQERVLGLHIDNGFMRKDESRIIEKRYKEAGFSNFIVEDASEAFLQAVYKEADPQKKRKAIGETFIRVRDSVVARLKLAEDDWLLGQGTLYPDIIESGGTKNSHVIKTHHNRVDGIQALIEKGLIIEPLKDLYKDEVRIIGKQVGLSDELVFRHPFPGPGLSINVLCSDGVFADRAEFEASGERIKAISIEGALTKGRFSGISVLPVRSVGVQGDFRTYRFPAVLSFGDIFGDFPSWDELEELSSKITNASADVNRTVVELWKRPGAEPALRELWCDKPRLDQTREADAIVLDELKKAGWYSAIFQHLTINLPLASGPDRCSIVLRPVVSEDVMTARFAHLDRDLLKRIVERIAALGFVDAVYYDITNKPPATFGWE